MLKLCGNQRVDGVGRLRFDVRTGLKADEAEWKKRDVHTRHETATLEIGKAVAWHYAPVGKPGAVRKSTSASGRPRGIIYYSGRLDAARECLASSHEAYSPERLISAQAAAFVGTADSTWTSLVAHQRFARGENCSTSFEQLLSRHWRERCNPNMPQGLVARELLARGVESFRRRCV